VSKASVFEDEIAYLRINRVDDEVSGAVRDAYDKLNATNKLKGIVLDLRFTDGRDYAEAAATADLFVTKAEPLLTAGAGVVSSHAKTNAIALPVAVLVNQSTAAAAEALAAVLRQTGAGLILGSRTAGRALLTRDFPLKSGGQLRVGTGAITLGDGSALSLQGIKPDIDVTVSVEDERAYYADAFRVVAKANGSAALSATNGAGGTNATRRVRLNEAELVREHREGLNAEAEVAARPPEPATPVVSDPALARAIDLLKGLAVVRQR
jgi:C-terminal processing protease CtpA/Prc